VNQRCDRLSVGEYENGIRFQELRRKTVFSSHLHKTDPRASQEALRGFVLGLAIRLIPNLCAKPGEKAFGVDMVPKTCQTRRKPLTHLVLAIIPQFPISASAFEGEAASGELFL